MSEFLAVDRALDGEASTVEGRLADIMASSDCVVEIDEYKLSDADKGRVVSALRVVHAMTMAFCPSKKPDLGNAAHMFSDPVDRWEGWPDPPRWS
jgi:hypothetical protein